MESVTNAQGTNTKKNLIIKFLKDAKTNYLLSNTEIENVVQWLSGSIYSDARDLNLNFARKQLEKVWSSQTKAYDEAPRTLSVFAIDNISGYFYKVSQMKGNNSEIDKINCVAELLDQTSDLEQKYIECLILGQMPEGYGISTKNLIDCIASACGYEKAYVALQYAFCGDIGKVAQYAFNNKLDQIDLTPFVPIKPMLAEASNITDAVKTLQIPFIADTKYDGARCQAHKVGDEVKLFSRNLENITESFPDIVNAVTIAFREHDVILDGEIVAVKNVEDETDSWNEPLPFQYVQKRLKRKKDIDAMAKEVPCCYYIFDILWHNGENLMMKSFEDRTSRLLDDIDPNWTLDTIAPAEGEYCYIAGDAEKTLREALQMYLDQGYEGIVVKELCRPYSMDRRDWIKIKAIQEAFTAMDTLDCVVMGFKYGTGKWHDMVGSIHVGVLSDGSYLGLCDVSTSNNLSDAERKELVKLLEPIAIGNKGDTKFIDANTHKIIVEVAFEEIMTTDMNACGYSLRFPRFIRIRDDKETPDDMEKVEKMFKSQMKRR
jgi:DNA ligase-1